MPFELLKGIGKDYAYNPMLHGFSKREIKDTLRRMEVLMKDLDELTTRKEKEKKRLEGLVPVVDWIGRDVNKEKIHEAYDHACWAAMDKAGIEFELPVIEQALEHAPDVTPTLRHEDYYRRCRNLEARRGEYWRINPTFRDFYSKEGAAGIGLPTPEKDKYRPTQQVPWQQDAPSPPPLPPTPPPPSPPITSDSCFQRTCSSTPKVVTNDITLSTPTTPRRKPQRRMPPRRLNIAPSRPPSRYALPQDLWPSCTSSSSSEFLHSGPSVRSFPIPGGSYYRASPSVPKSDSPCTPWSSPEVEFSSPLVIPKAMRERFSWMQNSANVMDEKEDLCSLQDSPLQPITDKELESVGDENFLTSQEQTEEDPCSLQDSPIQLITDKEFESVGDEYFLTSQEQTEEDPRSLQDSPLKLITDKELESVGDEYFLTSQEQTPPRGKSTSPQGFVTPSVTQTGSPSTPWSSPEVEFSSPLYMGNAVVESERGLEILADVMDEVNAINVQLMKLQAMAHYDNEDNPLQLITDKEFKPVCDEYLLTSQEQPEEGPSSLQDSPLQLITKKEFKSVDDEYFLTSQVQPEEDPSTSQDSPLQLITEKEFESVGDEYFLTSQVQPEEDPSSLQDSPLQLITDKEFESVDDEYFLTSQVQPREERWKERLGRWKAQEDRQREEERLRRQCAQERQTDAESLFGIRRRDISIPSRDARTPPRLLPETLPWDESPVDHISPPHPTMAWQRPLPPIAGRPLPKHMRKEVVYRPVLKHRPLEKSIKHTGKGKQIVRPKPSHIPRPHISERPPSRLLYPKTKGGPTISQPDKPSTSQCIYNTRRGQYEHLDSWERSPENYSNYEKDHYFDLHRQSYEEMLKPGPGVVAPVPAPPPPLPPPEYGPEPECLSVYVPESVDESPGTVIERLNDSVDRFECKMDLVRQKLKSRIPIRTQSKRVSEEYTSNTRRAEERAHDEPLHGPYTKTRISTPQAQPAQIQYGSVRAPPKTASSYQSSPKCRPASDRAIQRRRLFP